MLLSNILTITDGKKKKKKNSQSQGEKKDTLWTVYHMVSSKRQRGNHLQSHFH